MIATVEDGHFRIHPAEQAPGLRGTIDSFLVSLARERGKRAIVVALEGTDGEGTLGVQEVKEAGGLVLAEATPESQAGRLGSSDEPAALADAVLPVEEIAPRLLALVDQVAGEAPATAVLAPGTPETQEALASVASLLRQRTGHDFHGYKPGTFLRRVQRRMQALLLDDLQAYIEALRTQPDEAQSLFNDLLIGVTEFFRDKSEWDRLEREVIPRLFEGKGERDALRVWVVGCSTGEEAYSLAILLAEHMAQLVEPPHVQIFASDLDGRALAAARAGRYTGRIADQMSPERLGRWFVREGDTYHVTKELREMCIFSQHSLIKDAPFSRLDLVSCRNLLIYLDADLQERAIPLFHFALRPGGFLFLGNSENASRHQALFEPIEPRSRIFRRLDTATRAIPAFPFTTTDRRWSSQASRAVAPGAPEAPVTADAADLTRWAERVMERHSPAYVVVDARHDVLHFSGNIGQFLAPSRGAASLNLLQLIHPGLRLDLRAALSRAAEEGRPVELQGLELSTNPHRLTVDLVVEPRSPTSGDPAGFLVAFKDCAPRPEGTRLDPALSGPDQAEHLRRLEEELRVTRDRLQGTVEELESTNEELKSSNEEYQSLNEELQSANEELETSKEELQSINEELTTVNGELAHRVQELGRANSDLKNFLESTQIATLFLDNELRVTNFTPAAVDLFHLIETDEGRPIAHIKARVHYDELQADARRVLRTLAPVEREVGDPETGARFAARILPYRSTDNVIAGVVVTFVDVTARREAEERLRESEERQTFLLMLSDALRPLTNPAEVQSTAYRLLAERLDVDRAYYVEVDEAAGLARVERDYVRGGAPSLAGEHPVAAFAWSVDLLRRGGHVVSDTQTSSLVPEGDRPASAALQIIACMGAPLIKGGQLVGALCVTDAKPREWTEREVGLLREVAERIWSAIERARAEVALKESEARLRDVLRIRTVGVVFWNRGFRLAEANEAFLEMTGLSHEEALGQTWQELTPPEFHPASLAAIEEVTIQGECTPYEKQYFRKDGSRWWGLFTARRIGDEVVEFVLDVTERREAEAELRESEERFRAIVETARDYAIFTMDAEGRIETWPPGAQEVFGWTAEEAVGQPLDMTFTPEDREAGEPGKEREKAREVGQAPNVRWHLRKDGSRVFIEGIVRPLTGPDGALSGFVKVGQDVTQRQAMEAALRESEERFRQFGETSSDVLWIRDCKTLAYEYLSPAYEEIFGTPREDALHGNQVMRWLETVHPEDRDRVLDLLRRVRDGESIVGAYRIIRRSDGEVRWIRNTDFPLLDAEGRVQRLGGISHDATEEVEARERLEVLVAELQHRTRNLIGVVSSIATQTMAHTGPTEAFREEFGHRMAALARVQGLLSRSEQEPITLRALLLLELDALGATENERVRLDGPWVRIRPTIVQTLALVVHELATNARKYGALSEGGGRLSVEWRLRDSEGDGGRRLFIEWCEESLAPADATPSAAERGGGYGRRLIERALPYALEARTTYELDATRLRCTIDLPHEWSGQDGSRPE